MFSYRHAFHAGNHADVLKHAILVHLLEHFNLKDSPYWVVDTHAGAGIYDLSGEWASGKSKAGAGSRKGAYTSEETFDEGLQRKPESADGVSRLLTGEKCPILVSHYLKALEAFNPQGGLRFYPGSPWLALQAMRGRDRLRLFELHPTEIEVLHQNLAQHPRGRSRQVMIMQADGFEGIKALLPPPTRRGLVLIDPSYEDKLDYRHTLTAVQEGLKRFETGSFAVWYPLVSRKEVSMLTRALEQLDAVWVHATLQVKRPSSDGHGMFGSGMFIVNPPWTLHDRLLEALPWMTATLGQDERARHTLKRSARS